MKIFAETDRLILREITLSDADGMFILDSDPLVHTYLGNNPVKTIEESRETIRFIRKQYTENGIGRWAAAERATGSFIGWAGLKLVKELTNRRINYYDLGYRFIRSCWGRGFATEAALASLSYGFNTLGAEEIFAMADPENAASAKVLEKSGLQYSGTFHFDGVPHGWYEITRDRWLSRHS